MSLRSWRSWMPARKSCASRIMGERLVRAMAVSTSISTLARVPWTISTRIGSTVVPSAVSRLPCSYAVGRPAVFTGASAAWGWAVVAVVLMGAQASLVMTRLPIASTRTVKPGWTGTVEPNSSTIAGPARVSPARRSGRQ